MRNRVPKKRVSGGKKSVPLSNLTYEVAKESSEHLNEVKMRALRGNCQKFPLKERNLERRVVVQIQSSRPDLPKKGFHPLLGVPLCSTDYPRKGMRFARSESDAQRFISLRDLNPRLARVSQGERAVLSLFKGELVRDFLLKHCCLSDCHFNA